MTLRAAIPPQHGRMRAQIAVGMWAGRALVYRMLNGRDMGSCGQQGRLRGLLGGFGLGRLAGRAGWLAHAGSGRDWADHGPHPDSEAGAQ